MRGKRCDFIRDNFGNRWRRIGQCFPGVEQLVPWGGGVGSPSDQSPRPSELLSLKSGDVTNLSLRWGMSNHHLHIVPPCQTIPGYKWFLYVKVGLGVTFTLCDKHFWNVFNAQCTVFLIYVTDKYKRQCTAIYSRKNTNKGW